ncbi:MAG: phosphocholine cytidylyltransferase family protein [Gammaproteobacteria bacterium]|nr:phosphocholine cytidylyltransferase family protein [Gammaproteobacteria bacterium]
MKCLIIAAGQGSRLSQKGDSKPLIPLLGTPIIEHVIGSVTSAGINDFCVVTGFNGEPVRGFLDKLANRCPVTITHVNNDDWEQGNGLSVLKARDILTEPFILVMCDHLFDPAILRDLIKVPPITDTVTLAVDFDLKSPQIDMEDVTKVLVSKEEKVEAIGKELTHFNAFDTGIFYCTSALFGAIDYSQSQGDTSLSGGIRRLASQGKVNIFDIGGHFWIDVDDPQAYGKAEQALQSQAEAI